MIRFAISPAAYAVIAAGVNPDRLAKPLRSPLGDYYVWLYPQARDLLEARRQSWETYSETIIRIASELEANAIEEAA